MLWCYTWLGFICIYRLMINPTDIADTTSGRRDLRRQLRIRIRVIGRRVRRFVYHHLLHADDPPHRLALGVGIGVFVRSNGLI